MFGDLQYHEMLLRVSLTDISKLQSKTARKGKGPRRAATQNPRSTAPVCTKRFQSMVDQRLAEGGKGVRIFQRGDGSAW